MEIGDRIATGEIENPRRVPPGMDASLHEGHVGSIVLDDIDFATLRPRIAVNVGSHHPERGPHADAGGQFGMPLNAAVLGREKALSLQTGGADGDGAGILSLGADMEEAARDVGVVGLAGIRLEFVVPPTASTGVELPLGGIDIGVDGRSEEHTSELQSPMYL